MCVSTPTTWLVVAWSWQSLAGHVLGTVQSSSRRGAREAALERWPERGRDGLLVVGAQYARVDDLLHALAVDGRVLLRARAPVR